MLVDNGKTWRVVHRPEPIHALYPANPESAAAHSPSSRRWLNADLYRR